MDREKLYKYLEKTNSTLEIQEKSINKLNYEFAHLKVVYNELSKEYRNMKRDLKVLINLWNTKK